MGGNSKLQQPEVTKVTPPPTVQEEAPITAVKTPPAFGFAEEQAAPVAAPKKRSKKPAAAKAPPSADDIARKKAELDADPSILKPGDSWDAASQREDKTITDAAAKRYGIKRTAKLYDPMFCGRQIKNINILCKDKIDAVNTAFNNLKDENVKKQITDSLQHVTGQVYRVMSDPHNMDDDLKAYGLAGYRSLNVSDHAFGCAIDINENMGSKQNHHFYKKDDKALIKFMESTIQKYDPDFSLEGSKGMDQFKGINSFPEHLNKYVNTILGHAEEVDIFADEKATKKELAACKTDKKACATILAKWEIFKGYAKGTKMVKKDVPQGKGKKPKKKDVTTVNTDESQYNPADPDALDLKGVVDFNETFVKIMLDAKWQWGGDYGAGNKDYMHFEDTDAMKKMKTPE